MTAVELTIPGRRYTISGTGYSTEGTSSTWPASRRSRSSRSCSRWRWPCDAVVTDAGEMIGDPTEGALVVLAEKGGVDA